MKYTPEQAYHLCKQIFEKHAQKNKELLPILDQMIDDLRTTFPSNKNGYAWTKEEALAQLGLTTIQDKKMIPMITLWYSKLRKRQEKRRKK